MQNLANRRSHVPQFLLTGTTGFLGAYLALYLIKQTDAHLVCVARARAGLSASDRVLQRLKHVAGLLRYDDCFKVDADAINQRLTVLEGNIREPRLGIAPEVYGTLRADAVWHCAADVDFAEHRRRQVMATNYQGTLNVLALARDLAARGVAAEFNYVSTAYVCGNRGGEITESLSDEAAPVNNPYEESKRLCELAIFQAHTETGLAYRIMRPSIIVGHSRMLDVDSASGLYTYLSVMLRLKDTIRLRMPEYFDHHCLTVLCDEDVTLNLVCVDAVVEAMVRIAAHGRASSRRIYQIINPAPPRVRDYLRTVTQIFGIRIEHTTREEDLNPVDSLLNSQVGIYGAYLRNNKIFRHDQTLRFSGMSAARFQLTHEIQTRLTQGICDHFNENERIQRNRQRSVTQLLVRKTLSRQGREPLGYYLGGQGSGETLVIVNAYGQSLAFWDALASRMVEYCRVAIWQVRGTLSQSGGMDRAYPISEHVQDMLGIFDAEDIARAHIIGWCTGPKTALEFYAANPQRVASLMFLTGCFIHEPALKSLYTEYENTMDALCRMVNERPQIAGQLTEILKSVLLGKRKPDAAGLDAGNPDGVNAAAARAEALQPDSATPHAPLIEGVLALISEDIKPLVLEPFLTSHSIVNYARQLLAFWSHDVSAILSRVAVPTLFIGGEVDNIAAAKLAREVSRRVPGATYAEVQGGTHYMHYDNHALLGEMITTFMRAVREGLVPSAPFEFRHGLVRLERAPVLAAATVTTAVAATEQPDGTCEPSEAICTTAP